ISSIEDAMLLFSVGDENYNLSTGDTPYHPLRYALGLKSYGVGKLTRLRPRWRADGATERAYSGRVHAFLLSPLEHQALRPRHLVSLVHEGDLSIDPRILNERETTVSGMMAKEMLFEVLTLKYPSFVQKEYQDYYLHRYGMDKELYDHYRKKILESKPHSKERKRIKFLLGEHLCAYHEACLIEDARLEARNRGGWLVYHDRVKGFSLVPPPVYPATSKDKSSDRYKAGQAQRKYQRKKAEQKSGRQDERGTLETILQEYDILPGKSLENVLQAMLGENSILIEDVEELAQALDPQEYLDYFIDDARKLIDENEPAQKCFCKAITLLSKLSQQNNIEFTLQSFLFKKNIVIKESGEANPKKYDLIYFGGDGFYGLVRKLQNASAPITRSQKKRKKVIERETHTASASASAPAAKRLKANSSGQKQKRKFQSGNSFMDFFLNKGRGHVGKASSSASSAGHPSSLMPGARPTKGQKRKAPSAAASASAASAANP
ncbi:MAG: hypothetical protein K0U12_03535, partial [Gammaproteobacteria bacterium]|nr:hypothetical protein [Gammaproteobacteria bacterium]